ncbi:MAG TPA: response regulator [Candidatus Limnocylindrales bacterium]|nr:response regulator [Candidatus Limnocylindrales bacterium]
MATPRILVVEDSKTMRFYLRDLLKKEGYLIETASNGKEALEAIEESQRLNNAFNIVITDVVMPEMDGLELLQKVKEINRDIIIIVITSETTIETAIRALNLGATNFLRKPPDSREILDVVWRASRLKELSFESEELIPFMTRTLYMEIPSQIRFIKGISHNIIQEARLMGYNERELRDKIPVTIDEAVTNAIKHGNKGDESKKVKIQVDIDTEKIKIVIKDEGEGFKVQEVPDPTDPKNFLKMSGRGILFMRLSMDEVVYNDRGNELTLIKYKYPKE